jgi:hypothetical protein
MNKPPAPPTPGPKQHLPIELPDEVAEGLYSNLMFITHSPSEFVLYARIVMTPQHAKALSQLLERNIGAFEEAHGPIKLGKTAEDARIGFTPAMQVTPAPNEAEATKSG